MTAPLDALHHIAIEAPDIHASVEWYQENFECEVVYQDATWAMIAFANIRMALVTPGQHPPHIAFALDDAASFGELTTHRDGSKSVYVEDPAGNSVEIVER